MIYKCSVCKEERTQGFFNHTNRFICRRCEHLGNSLLFSTYEIVDGEVLEISPFSYAQNEKARFLDYAYTLFGNKFNPAFFGLLQRYEDEGKYTYLGMARALEYFYTVKKNDVTKAKSNIGIIPYIYDEAQEFYLVNDRHRRNNYLTNLRRMEEAKHSTHTEVEVSGTKPSQRNKFQIDMEGGV